MANAAAIWSSSMFLEKIVSLVSEIPLQSILAKFANSNKVNASCNNKDWYCPYKDNLTLAELNLTEDVSGLVRLSGPDNIKGDWFTTMSQIKGLTPMQLKYKFALKYAPTNMTPVSLSGPVRVGEAAKVPVFGTGGGFQIEALQGSKVKYGKTVPLP